MTKSAPGESYKALSERYPGLSGHEEFCKSMVTHVRPTALQALGRMIICHKKKKDNQGIQSITGVSLVDNLNQRGLPSCGTVRSDRKGLPQLKQDRDLSRGECDYAVRSDGIAYVKWKDKRCVMFLSTIESPQEMSTVNRKESDGSITQIQCPSIAKTYHANMGCVDKADMLRSLYTIDRKTKRSWLRLFWYFVDVSIVNSCILYSLSNTGLVGTRNLKGTPGPSSNTPPPKRFKPQEIGRIKNDFHWCGASTRILVTIRRDIEEDFNKPKTRKKKLWNVVSERLAKENIIVTPQECDRKWRNLLSTYKTRKDLSK
ncbi:hypothetical protein C0J52_16848 [Blattella germanica]|nr:hypothetical protein C0J52_16848 [Blattella germanica]